MGRILNVLKSLDGDIAYQILDPRLPSNNIFIIDLSNFKEKPVQESWLRFNAFENICKYMFIF